MDIDTQDGTQVVPPQIIHAAGTTLLDKILNAYTALFLVALVLAVHTFTTVSQFKSLPAPIFGGDQYYQLGSIKHIMAGGNPLASSSILGGVPGYLPVFSLLVAAFSTIFRVDAFTGLIYFSVLVAFLMPFSWALAIRNFVENEWWALIGALAVLWVVSIENPQSALPILKYTEFTFALLLPLFLHFLYRAYSDFTVKNVSLLAIFYAILTISHMIIFIAASIMLAVVLLFGLIQASVAGHAVAGLCRRNLKAEQVFVVITGLILLCYWYEPLFVHHLRMPYDRVHIDFPDYAVGAVQLDFLSSRWKSLFFDFSSMHNILKSIMFSLTFAAVVIFIKRAFHDKVFTFLLAIFVASFLLTFSYFITEPLLNLNFLPPYMYWMTIPFSLVIFGVYFLDHLLPFSVKGKQKLVCLSLVAIFLSLDIARFRSEQASNIFFNESSKTIPSCLSSLSSYIEQNSSVNDVFLTGKELGFMLNSLTGRKLVTNRWLHQNDPYMDLPRKDLDAAIMLYGDDLSTRIDLLRQYRVKYLYWDFNWVDMEYRRDQYGRQMILDPLRTLDTPAARNALSRNNVKYQIAKTWLDPAIAFPDYRKFNLLLVSSSNYTNIDMPWEKQLNKYLEEVWEYQEGGKKIAALYKIKWDDI